MASRSADLAPLGSVTPTFFQDFPFHRATRVGAVVPSPLRLEVPSTATQSVASTHEILGTPPKIPPPPEAGRAGPAVRAAAATASIGRTPDVGWAIAVAGMATPPSTVASATSPEMAIVRTRLLI